MPALVLASTSRYRRAQLEQLGLTFSTHPPLIDEDIIKAMEISPSEIAQKLAKLKVEFVAKSCPNSLIIAGDQIAEIDGQILNKPETDERAFQQLKQLSGRVHHLWTAIAIHNSSTNLTKVHLEKYTLTMRTLTDAQIRSYIAIDQPLDCTGSYRIEALGISLFEAIEGRDHTGIIGLPLMQLVSILNEFGLLIPTITH